MNTFQGSLSSDVAYQNAVIFYRKTKFFGVSDLYLLPKRDTIIKCTKKSDNLVYFIKERLNRESKVIYSDLHTLI